MSSLMTIGAVAGVARLHWPNVAGSGPDHVPVPPSRCSEDPTDVVVFDSATPMSTDVSPAAGPSVADNVPPYERNSTTWPDALTSGIPSGFPFWIPLAGY